MRVQASAMSGELFEPESTSHLPEPAQRLLIHALPKHTPISSTAELTMTGQIKLGPRWMPFTATQVIHAGTGFIWQPTVGRRLIKFTGADVLGPNDARMEFRLHGRIPIVRATGPDVARSAAGRLAAETVAWLPQTLTPQAGATWKPKSENQAIVSVPTPSGDHDVTITVSPEGRLTDLSLHRWKDSAKPPHSASFGGAVHRELVTGTGVRVAGAGTVGWDWDGVDRSDGVFFRYTVNTVEHH